MKGAIAFMQEETFESTQHDPGTPGTNSKKGG